MRNFLETAHLKWNSSTAAKHISYLSLPHTSQCLLSTKFEDFLRLRKNWTERCRTVG